MCGPAGILHAVNFLCLCRVEVFVLEVATSTKEEVGEKRGATQGKMFGSN